MVERSTTEDGDIFRAAAYLRYALGSRALLFCDYAEQQVRANSSSLSCRRYAQLRVLDQVRLLVARPRLLDISV